MAISQLLLRRVASTLPLRATRPSLSIASALAPRVRRLHSSPSRQTADALPAFPEATRKEPTPTPELVRPEHAVVSAFGAVTRGPEDDPVLTQMLLQICSR